MPAVVVNSSRRNAPRRCCNVIITLHYITLHYITLRYITLNYISPNITTTLCQRLVLAGKLPRLNIHLYRFLLIVARSNQQ